MVSNEIISRIAQKIRAKRMERNMTIQQLADKTKVSKGLLSKIENSRTLPSVPVLVDLIQALGISLKEFFEDMVLLNGKDYLLIKKEKYTFVEREGRAGFNYQFILSQSMMASTMEVVLLTVEPGAKGRPTTSHGFEYKYLITGECEYHVNNEIVKMETGDSIYFDASVPHLPVNNTNQNAVMLVLYFIIA